MRPLFTAFVVFVLGFVLASCGSDSGGPDVDSTPSASPTPTLSPPTKPANLHEATQESAADFVYYWIDVFNYANTTGDLVELKGISGPECGGCNTAIEMITETYIAGGHVLGNAWLARELEVRSEANSVFITAEILSDSGVLVEKAGMSPKRIKPHRSTMFMWAEHDGNTWVLTDLGSELEE